MTKLDRVMIDDEEPTASLILGEFNLRRRDLPFRESAKPVDGGIYRSRVDSYLWVYHADNDHWNCFAEGSF